MNKVLENRKNRKYLRRGLLFVFLVVDYLFFVKSTFIQDSDILAHSQTMIGKEVKFKLSQATGEIKNYYVSKSRDALIARITLKENPSTPLPLSASSYVVMTKTDTGQKEIPAYFGRMSTDGDMFVIIPKPSEETYSIIVANRDVATIETDNNQSNNKITVFDPSNRDSITKILSDADYDLGTNNKSVSKKSSEDKQTDTIAFNMTVTPRLKEKAYQPTVLDVEHLLSEKDGKTYFDFEEYWKLVYKQPLVDKYTKKQKELKDELSTINANIQNVQKTLDRNENDQNAQKRLSQLQNDLEANEEAMEKASVSLRNAQVLEYQESYFNDYTTKMFYVGK